MRTHTQRGFSLTEMAIVLGVAGTILSGIWYLASNSYETARRQQAFDAVIATVNNVRTFYSGQLGMPRSGYRILVSNFLNTARNIIPHNLERRPLAATCTNVGRECSDTPWGNNAATRASGSFLVCDWGLGAGQTACNAGALGPPIPLTNFFAVSLSNLPVGACIQVTSRLTSSLGPAGLLDVFVNGASMIPLGSINPVPTINLTASCNNVVSNNVVLVYRLQVSGG